MKKSLIIVDLQNDYFPGGKMELVNVIDAVANAKLLLNEFRSRGFPVIHVQHISLHEGATFFLPGTEGTRISETVAPQPDEKVVVKNFPNSFRGTSLSELLRAEEIDKLVICGAMSHMCIDATTRAAFDLGFDCTVAEDACATRDLQFNSMTIKATDVHASFMAALASVYAKVMSAKEVIDRTCL